MTDQLQLEPGEIVRWQGRPAPRCYTFRNWKHSLFGLFLSVPSLFWLVLGRELAADGGSIWLAWLPVPLVLVCAYLVAGQLLLARIAWEKIFYTVTDQRLLLRSGLFSLQLQAIPLTEVHGVKVRRHGPQLVTLHLDYGDSCSVILHCLEHPDALLTLLKAELDRSAAEKV